MQIVKKTSSGSRAIIKADYGVQVTALWIILFFQCLCGKDASGNGIAVFLNRSEWKREKGSQWYFPGAVFNLYYFEVRERYTGNITQNLGKCLWYSH